MGKSRCGIDCLVSLFDGKFRISWDAYGTKNSLTVLPDNQSLALFALWCVNNPIDSLDLITTPHFRYSGYSFRRWTTALYACSSDHLLFRQSAGIDSHSMPGLALYRYLFTPGGSSGYSSDGHVWRCEHVDPTDCTNGIPNLGISCSLLPSTDYNESSYSSPSRPHSRSHSMKVLPSRISDLDFLYCHFLWGITFHPEIHIHTVQWTFEPIGNVVDTAQHCWT